MSELERRLVDIVSKLPNTRFRWAWGVGPVPVPCTDEELHDQLVRRGPPTTVEFCVGRWPQLHGEVQPREISDGDLYDSGPSRTRDITQDVLRCALSAVQAREDGDDYWSRLLDARGPDRWRAPISEWLAKLGLSRDSLTEDVWELLRELYGLPARRQALVRLEADRDVPDERLGEALRDPEVQAAIERALCRASGKNPQ